MEERKNIVYTAADLQRYHSGTMREAEMHALEKAAMDDPFLSEALEGYAFTTTAEKDIIELKNRLSEKEKNKKGLLLFAKTSIWLSAAAVLALIFGTIYLTLNSNKKNKGTILAKNENVHKEGNLVKNDSTKLFENEQAPASTSAGSATPGANPGFTEVKPIPVPSRKINSDRYTYSTSKEAAANKDAGFDSTDRQVSANKTAPAKEHALLADTKHAKTETKLEDVVINDGLLKKRNISGNENKKKYKFSGKVVDEQGSPVAFASIFDPDSKNSTTTDALGNFAISNKDSIFPATIASVGYYKLKKELKNDSEQTIILSRDTQQLTAVVVTSLGQVRQKASVGYMDSALSGKVSGLSVAQANEPVGGKLRFNQSINDSAKKSLLANKEIIKGDVILSFKVKKNGELKNVKVEKSLCKPCDEEAKRLLIEGPKWKYVNNKRATVTIIF